MIFEKWSKPYDPDIAAKVTETAQSMLTETLKKLESLRNFESDHVITGVPVQYIYDAMPFGGFMTVHYASSAHTKPPKRFRVRSARHAKQVWNRKYKDVMFADFCIQPITPINYIKFETHIDGI